MQPTSKKRQTIRDDAGSSPATDGMLSERRERQNSVLEPHSLTLWD